MDILEKRKGKLQTNPKDPLTKSQNNKTETNILTSSLKAKVDSNNENTGITNIQHVGRTQTYHQRLNAKASSNETYNPIGNSKNIPESTREEMY